MDSLQKLLADMKTATRITERKNAAMRLQECISDDDEICHKLDYNTINASAKGTDKLTWTRLFTELGDYFAKETEKSSITHVNKKLYFGMVNLVFTKASTRDSVTPFLSWEKIYEFIAKHLQTERYAIMYGPSLINMLERFLSVHIYTRVIDGHRWTGIMALLIKCYKKYSIATSEILKCMKICIVNGSAYASTIPFLRSKVVNFYLKIVREDSAILAMDLLPYVEGVTALSRENAGEFRRILCKLGETVIPQILQVHSFTKEQENAVVELLLVQYNLHLPCDVDVSSVAAYVDDSPKWKEILRLMYAYCIDTVEDTATKRTTRNRSEFYVSERMMLLAAKCTKQISSPSLNEGSSSEEEDGSRKKKMRYRSFNVIINEIHRKSVTEGLTVWLDYMSSVLTRFPELVGSKMNFSNLVHLGCSLFNTNFMIRKEFYTYFMSLLGVERYLQKEGIVSSANDTWNTVWDLTVKSITISDDKEGAIDLLHQILIEIRPTNVASLLKLYIDSSMPPLESSVKLLASYLSLCSLPLHVSNSTFPSQAMIVDEDIAVTASPRLALIRWLMHVVKGGINDFEPLVASILCSVIVKQSQVIIQQSEVDLHSPSKDHHTAYEKQLMGFSFESVPQDNMLNHVNKKLAAGKMPLHISLIIEQKPAERLAEALQNDYDKDCKLNPDHVDHQQYHRFISRLQLYLNVLNILEKYSIGEPTGKLGCKITVEKIFDKAMTACNEYIAKVLDAISSHPRRVQLTQELIKSTRSLFSNEHFCSKIKATLASKFAQSTLDAFKGAFRSSLARYTNNLLCLNNNDHGTSASRLIYEADVPSKIRIIQGWQHANAAELELLTRPDRSYEKMSLEALHFMIELGLASSSEKSQETFSSLLHELELENFSSFSRFLLLSCEILVSNLTKILQQPATGALCTTAINLLQRCCRKFHKIPDCCVKLWSLFTEMLRVVGPVEGSNRHHLMILVGTMDTFLKNGCNPYHVFEKAFETYSELARRDPALLWSEFSPVGKSPIWVLETLHEFISISGSHRVRIMATETICLAYKDAHPFDYSQGITSSQEDPSTEASKDQYQERRKTFLDQLFQKLLGTFEVAETLSSDEMNEEGMNSICLSLSCLTRLIFAYPYTRKQSIMFLFMMVKLKQIDMTLAQRALQYASENSTKTMCCYFSYVLKKSLKLKYTVTDLPYQFFACDSPNTFFTKFQNEICLEYFDQDKMAELELFAKRFNRSVSDMIRECYGLIMARLTPGLATYTRGLQPRGLNLATCNQIHKRLIITLGGKDATDTLMATCLGDVVLNLVSLTFEPSIMDIWNCPEVRLPEPVPPYYSEATIETCLDFLKAASPHSNLTVIGYLAKTSHQCIYKILLSLAIRIHGAHDELEKYWRLHQFSFFISNLLLNEPKSVFTSIKEYVLNFVFNAYLRLLKTESDSSSKDTHLRFLRVVIYLINNLVVRITEEYIEEMHEFFDPVIRGVVCAINKHPELMEASKPVLTFLLHTHGGTFSSRIASLDPFSANLSEYEECREIQKEKRYGNRRIEWALTKEFEKLLEDTEDITVSGVYWTKERLRFLRELLSKRKRDLDRMVRNLESKRFSEECAKDPLHNLIQVMVGVIWKGSRDRDEEVVVEACRCLGEIGPVDLSVLVLPPFKNEGKITLIEDALLQIVKIIAGYMTSEDIRLVTASGKVLRSILEFEEGSKVLNEMLHGERLTKVLLPFRCMHKNLKKSVEKVDANMLETRLGLNEMNEGIDYRSWLMQLTTGIIECFKNNSTLALNFLPLCRLRVDFCEDIFPYVIYLCLQGGRTNPIVKRVMTSYFRNFFSKFVTNLNSFSEAARSYTPSSSGSNSSIIYTNKLALRCLIRVIQFLRRHPLPQEMKGNVLLTSWHSNFWLDINYLDVSRAAQFCGAYLTSILYIEIAATEMDMAASSSSHSSRYTDDSSEEDSSQEYYSQGASMYPRSRSEASKIEKLLLKAYSAIGETDAAYGCGSARFADVQSSIHHMEQTMDWHRMLMLANGSSVEMESCLDLHAAISLKEQGLYNVLWSFLKGVQTVGNSVLPEDLEQIQYECGWRLTKWDLNTGQPGYIEDCLQTPPGFQTCIYKGIQAKLAKDEINHAQAITDGYKSVSTELRHATLESSENIYGFLNRLQMLRVVEDFFMKDGSPDNDVETFIRKWNMQDRIPTGGFKYQEPVLFVRNVLLRAYDSQSGRANLESEIHQSLLSLISKAREAGRLDFAESCTAAMASICSRPSVLMDFEVAKNNWARGKGDIARHIMSKLIKKSNHDDELYPAMLLLYGDWLSISHSERPAVILERYLQRSCSLYEKRMNASSGTSSQQQEISKAYIVLAKYADAQYQNVTKYISSDVFVAKLDHLKRAKEEENQMKNSVDPDSRKSSHIIKRQSNYDMEEIHYIHVEQRKFLILALRHYLRGLKTSSEHDLLIFRAISLWLENGNATDERLVEETTQIFSDETMPSYKYIVVLHQLSARLSSKTTMKNELLKDILLRCAEEHPYHALPVLLTQASLHKDENLPGKNSSLKVQLAGRVQAASDIVDSLKRSASLKTLVTRMEILWIQLIKLANINDGGRDGMQKNIPSDIMKCLNNLELVAVPTSTIPVLPSGNYKEAMIGIRDFGSTFGFVGGINSPKKIKCRGTNGISYNMLLKGQDDLRQDAVMQQVFSVMNRLLQVETKTRIRRLHIRTYKVIPLSQRTGVIEWVENTQTLGDYLVGSQKEPGAHTRYRPNDYKPLDCRRLMTEAKTSTDAEKKYSTYMRICENFKPVFRHFFFENFKEAGVFFEKRLAYTRSVATTSIVGYILGLGDRHVMNILIDNSTAEFIHIDLGVAFEQGRILPTPETIPFRLTRDVIDGMGISGVEGVFRKSSEMTMEVLRNNAEIIKTVLQVLLYDPLYMWALTNDRVAKVQPSDHSKIGNRKSKGNNVEPSEDSVTERNNSASRVLLRLRQKLMGIEEEGGQTGAISSGSSLSVDGHVSLLIQRAMDPDKLCRLFPGWQPYL